MLALKQSVADPGKPLVFQDANTRFVRANCRVIGCEGGVRCRDLGACVCVVWPEQNHHFRRVFGKPPNQPRRKTRRDRVVGDDQRFHAVRQSNRLCALEVVALHELPGVYKPRIDVRGVDGPAALRNLRACFRLTGCARNAG